MKNIFCILKIISCFYFILYLNNVEGFHLLADTFKIQNSLNYQLYKANLNLHRFTKDPFEVKTERKTKLTVKAIPKDQEETDVVIIGSGIGGLSCAAILAKYGDKVTICESHYLAGGCAHGFERNGYNFDSGPSMWSGLSQPSTNPLRQVLDIVEEEVEWITYDGWQMLTPDGNFRVTTGSQGDWEKNMEKTGGPGIVQQWKDLQQKMEPFQKACRALPPMAFRGDKWALLSLLPYWMGLLRTGVIAKELTGPFSDIYDGVVSDRFLRDWLNFLSFAISGLPADGTITAAMVYTLGDLFMPGAVLDYPIGGSNAIIKALVRGIEKHGGQLLLGAHVEKVIVEDGKAVGVILRDGKRIKAKKAVVSNASVWDTLKLLPAGALPEQYMRESEATPETGSFMHLHIGIDAKGLPENLEIHYTVVNSWEPVDGPMNVIIISIPSVLDPSLAPAGKHVVHAYSAGNEPYDIWKGLERGSDEYKQLKKQRAEGLWKALERIIPDIRERVEVRMVGTPLTHERFLRRHRGTYGPGIPAGKGSFPGPKTPLPGLLCCGDSTFPGLGAPAVAGSGSIAANTLTPIQRHLTMLLKLRDLKILQ